MRTPFLPIILFCCLLIAQTHSSYATNHQNETSRGIDDSIDDFILHYMEHRHIPGLAASLVINNTVRWQNAYGWAHIEHHISTTNDTLFKIASVSKTITATALMQLYEQGCFDLSDPINEYLPYPVIHPGYPTTPITFHMLLTHSSGIHDNWEYLFYFVGDAPIPFQTFLQEYLLPGGLYYDAQKNFCTWEPGTHWCYSNIAVALIGYLVEVISDTGFTDYVNTSLFTPLQMNESAWYLRHLNLSHIAMPYKWNGEQYIPYGHIGYVDVPAGDLRTSASQLIHFLTMYINNGSYNHQTILQNTTVQMMLTPQLSFQPNIGLIWWKSIIDGRTVWGHTGGDFGTRAMMHFDPATHIGVIILSNGEADLTELSDALFDYAETLENTPPAPPQPPSGRLQGTTQSTYWYHTNTTDPEGDTIYYQWDWGDGTLSEWLGPYHSHEICNASHTWNQTQCYAIRVKATDEYGAESPWSDPVTIFIGRTAILYGRIANLTSHNHISVFTAIHVRALTFHPWAFHRYTAGETIMVSDQAYHPFLGRTVLFGRFNMIP